MLLAFPGLLLAIALVAVLGPSLGNVLFALTDHRVGRVRAAGARSGAPRARVRVRAGGAGRRRRRRRVSSGATSFRARSPAVVVQATLGMAGAIIGEAALSFLGLGVQPPTPSWGTMLNGGRAHLLDAPHLTIVPGPGDRGPGAGIQFSRRRPPRRDRSQSTPDADADGSSPALEPEATRGRPIGSCAPGSASCGVRQDPVRGPALIVACASAPSRSPFELRVGERREKSCVVRAGRRAPASATTTAVAVSFSRSDSAAILAARGTASSVRPHQRAVGDQRVSRRAEMVLLLGRRGVEAETPTARPESASSPAAAHARPSSMAPSCEQRAAVERQEIAWRGRAGGGALERFPRLAEERGVVARDVRARSGRARGKSAGHRGGVRARCRASGRRDPSVRRARAPWPPRPGARLVGSSRQGPGAVRSGRPAAVERRTGRRVLRAQRISPGASATARSNARVASVAASLLRAGTGRADSARPPAGRRGGAVRATASRARVHVAVAIAARAPACD